MESKGEVERKLGLTEAEVAELTKFPIPCIPASDADRRVRLAIAEKMHTAEMALMGDDKAGRVFAAEFPLYAFYSHVDDKLDVMRAYHYVRDRNGVPSILAVRIRTIRDRTAIAPAVLCAVPSNANELSIKRVVRSTEWTSEQVVSIVSRLTIHAKQPGTSAAFLDPLGHAYFIINDKKIKDAEVETASALLSGE